MDKKFSKLLALFAIGQLMFTFSFATTNALGLDLLDREAIPDNIGILVTFKHWTIACTVTSWIAVIMMIANVIFRVEALQKSESSYSKEEMLQ